MKRISSGTTLRRRAIDELDTDFLTTLEELDKRLDVLAMAKVKPGDA